MSMLGMLAGGASASQTYVDDVFSTYLYTGNGSTQTINNGIDLAGKGGMVWIKDRSVAGHNFVNDTARGAYYRLKTNATDAQASTSPNGVTAFNSSGYSIGGTDADYNANGNAFTSWTFRKAPKFFDVVTWTGNGANRTIAHNLGIAPGMIVVKRTDTTGDWQVYHASIANTESLLLDTTAAKTTDATKWNSTTATSSVFSLGTHADVNANGGTYVAYLFAHVTAADGIIQAGSFTTDGSGNATVTLGWEPQYVLWKKTSGAGGAWNIQDAMRGMAVSGDGQFLEANASSAEYGASQPIRPTGAGFTCALAANPSSTYIYLAIRRPNKPPTSGTQVFSPNLITGSATTPKTVDFGFPFDLMLATRCAGGGTEKAWQDRLRGANKDLQSNGTQVEGGLGITCFGTQKNQNESWPWTATGPNNGIFYSGSGSETFSWNAFKRAPGFMDVVAYTGDGTNRNVTHNLGATPDLVIVKSRSNIKDWPVYVSGATTADQYLRVNTTAAPANYTGSWNAGHTATTFGISSNGDWNGAGYTYVAYLFASLPGISKVGSYTGNGSSQTINCGFSGGARFVLIKRTDSTGDWFVWDTVRGIVAGNDPHLSLNTTAAEVTTDDSIDPDNSGFIVNELAATHINVNAATYIYLAIA